MRAHDAGKSAALRDAKRIASTGEGGKVIKSGSLHFSYSQSDFEEALKKHSTIEHDKHNSTYYAGVGYDISLVDIKYIWASGNPSKLGSLANFFICSAETETRITDSNPPGSIALLVDPPKHPIHAIQEDERLLSRLSNYFRRAFGSDLMLHFGAGGKVPLFVGTPPALTEGEHLLSRSYLKRLEQSAASLETQGDGMRSFVSVMLRTVAQANPTMLFIDEPEAFLHPPQARLIGEFLASERPKGVQLFVSTHSSAVLDGILRAADINTNIVRIDRTANTNSVSILEPETAKSISSEPLTRYSNVLDGVFHKSVIVCESVITQALAARSDR